MSKRTGWAIRLEEARTRFEIDCEVTGAPYEVEDFVPWLAAHLADNEPTPKAHIAHFLADAERRLLTLPSQECTWGGHSDTVSISWLRDYLTRWKAEGGVRDDFRDARHALAYALCTTSSHGNLVTEWPCAYHRDRADAAWGVVMTRDFKRAAPTTESEQK